MRMYHGGQKGLRVGAYLEPPSVTGVRAMADHLNDAAGTAHVRRDRVFVTPSVAAAVMYAAMHPSGGAVYIVEPLGECEPDPDCTEEGLSFQCPRARIVRVRRFSGYERNKVRKAFGIIPNL